MSFCFQKSLKEEGKDALFLKNVLSLKKKSYFTESIVPILPSLKAHAEEEGGCRKGWVPSAKFLPPHALGFHVLMFEIFTHHCRACLIVVSSLGKMETILHWLLPSWS